MAGKNRQKMQERSEKARASRGREIKGKFVESEQRKIIPLSAKNDNQKIALQAFTEKQLVGQFGSAGSGKSELMCWWACKQWLEGKVDNIVIARPYQHLGNDYGATKGNDAEKLLPFCMPMLMKIKKYLGVSVLRNNFKLDGFDDLFAHSSGIQIVPLEKIQGLSYSNKSIILADEIQSATVAQIKALCTRPEEGCQVLMAGDDTQSALRGENGLSYIQGRLEAFPHESAQIITYTPEDNCRKGIAGHLTRVFELDGQW